MTNSIPRLLYGFVSQSAVPLNVSLPWTTSEKDGAFSMNDNIVDATLDNLKAWAHTNWGERPYRFYFGLDARRYLFEQETVAKEAILNNARAQLNKYFKFLQTKKLEVLTSDDDSTVAPNSIRFVYEGILNHDKSTVLKISENIGF